MSKTTILIAIGGNALSPGETTGNIHEQFAHTREALRSIMAFLRRGYRLAITHGNGPQVGEELLRVELAADRVPPLPLGVCVAATQGTMGYMIEQSLQNALVDEGIERDVVSLITQVVVDANDPALELPSKYIGDRYTKERADNLARRFGWKIGEQEDSMWRRVVPSPTPISLINCKSIKHLVDIGSIVIASGGGGIPAYIMKNGHYEGVDAVIDKDLAAAVLGTDIGAQDMYILTDVPEVYLYFQTDRQQPVRRMSVKEAQIYLDDGHFLHGTMGPKIEAAQHFLLQGGQRVIITDTDTVEPALAGEGGTTIYP
ncbi:MAG: carbamate kinase [Fidelibacterota bacterium]|nr:MAG: carbamate kinase [Candidatus Neomarinimicrobiota bacterium]